jgi:hypothetical protein
MACVNTIDWHVHFLRVDRFIEAWTPACERAPSYGARYCRLTRAEDDIHHFTQISEWERKEDFDRYWQSKELADLRAGIQGLHNVPVLPHWHRIVVDTEAAQPVAS